MIHKDDDPGTKKSSLIRDFAKTSLGWELAIPIFAGAYLGHLIDKATNLSITFMLILTFIGIGVGYYNLVRHIEFEMLILRIQKKHQKEQSNQ
ncbi:MAG: AtpZ/AtpI family protein [Anaerolineaceae bacterium]|nr:AtpZ/AtpI family protein [Anaerolineaceae bacterium]